MYTNIYFNIYKACFIIKYLLYNRTRSVSCGVTPHIQQKSENKLGWLNFKIPAFLFFNFGAKKCFLQFCSKCYFIKTSLRIFQEKISHIFLESPATHFDPVASQFGAKKKNEKIWKLFLQHFNPWPIVCNKKLNLATFSGEGGLHVAFQDIPQFNSYCFFSP